MQAAVVIEVAVAAIDAAAFEPAHDAPRDRFARIIGAVPAKCHIRCRSSAQA
jgi:hypothetical protein